MPPITRIALYSHDTLGLGHVRRNIGIAGALGATLPDADILLLSGIPAGHEFALPPRTDLVTLPALRKAADGRYSPRAFRAPLSEVVDLRSAILDAALTQFAPDLLVVDKCAGGVFGELVPALASLRRRGTTRVVLGLRDILDEPAVAAREWRAERTDELVAAYFDAVWVYGDPRICDPVAEYGLSPAVARKVAFTGYLAPPRPTAELPAGVPLDRPFALCLLGGGQDGAALASAFARAPLPRGTQGVVVCGPHMPEADRADLDALARRRDDLVVLPAVPDCTAVAAQAEAVVAMAGYNTTVELLAVQARTLLVPRAHPRREQRIRAERLAGLGLVDTLEPERATGAAIGDWLAAVPATMRPAPPPALDGLAQLPAHMAALFDRGRTGRELARA